MTRRRNLLALVLLPLLALLVDGSSPLPARPAPPAAPAADAARLMATIRHFAEDDAGEPRSRYAYRVEMDALEDDLVARMGDALGERGSALLWPFPAKQPPGVWDPTAAAAACGSTEPASRVDVHPSRWSAAVPYRSTFHNVIGHLPGRNPGEGKFIVCSHFDAIGARTPGWQSWADPAPGADDNLSGTAAVLEMARLLATQPPLPFDIDFVCFDGEELGLWGSDTLAHAEKAVDAPILGVFNMDMIGYNPRVDSLVVMSNRSSFYLARYVGETEALDPQPGLGLQVTIDNLFNSDHAPFWTVGYPAFMMIENLRIIRHNPQYHQITDRPGTISRNGELVALGTNVYLRTLLRLAAGADTPPDLRIDNTDLLVAVQGSIESRTATPGDTIVVGGGIFNAGGDRTTPFTVRYATIDNDGVRHALTEIPVDTPIRNGGHIRVPLTYVAKEADAGAVTIEMELDDGVTTQTARRAIPVRQSPSEIAGHYIAPNPVRDPATARICYELTGEADVRITLFDFDGSEIGKSIYRYNTTTGLPDANTGTGLNQVPLSELLAGETLNPGIYLYRLEVMTEENPGGTVTLGKFAVLR